MRRLKSVKGHYLDLTDYGIVDKFDVYELGTYDFTDNLEFGESAGVYIFTCRDMVSTTSKKYHKETYLHELIYCGMTEQLNQRFYSHFHDKDSELPPPPEGRGLLAF